MFDWSYVLSQLDSLDMDYGTPFKTLGSNELFVLGAIVLILCCMKWALMGSENVLPSLLKFVGLYSFAYLMLYYYDTPFYNGEDFKHLIPDFGTYLANIIEQSRWDQALQRITYLLDHLQTPNLNPFRGIVDAHAIIAYILVEFCLLVFGSVLMIPIGTSFIALAVGVLFWPVFIPWVIVPGVSWLWWNPLSYIIKYAMYRPFAIALTYILAGVCNQWIDQALTLQDNQYSLAQFTSMTLVGLVFLTLMTIYMALFETPHMVRDFFGGGSGAGSNFLGSMTAFWR